MAINRPSYHPRNISTYTPDMTLAADVSINGMCDLSLGTPEAADADGILDGGTITTAAGGSFDSSDFKTTYVETNDDLMAVYGRCLTYTGGSAGDDASVTVKGRDYLGQPVAETKTLTGTTAVSGGKAFKWIDTIVAATGNANASSTLDVGWNDKLGLPYKTKALLKELEDAVAASSGTFVAGVDTQTASSADPRGTYDPNTATDGTTEFSLIAVVDNTNLHGEPHYFA